MFWGQIFLRNPFAKRCSFAGEANAQVEFLRSLYVIKHPAECTAISCYSRLLYAPKWSYIISLSSFSKHACYTLRSWHSFQREFLSCGLQHKRETSVGSKATHFKSSCLQETNPAEHAIWHWSWQKPPLFAPFRFIWTAASTYIAVSVAFSWKQRKLFLF